MEYPNFGKKTKKRRSHSRATCAIAIDSELYFADGNLLRRSQIGREMFELVNQNRPKKVVIQLASDQYDPFRWDVIGEKTLFMGLQALSLIHI